MSAPALNGGVDFNGTLGGVYIVPTEAMRDSFAEVWIKRPDGTVILHYQFSQQGGWCWLANTGMQIIGPVNVICSVKADILLAGL